MWEEYAEIPKKYNFLQGFKFKVIYEQLQEHASINNKIKLPVEQKHC